MPAIGKDCPSLVEDMILDDLILSRIETRSAGAGRVLGTPSRDRDKPDHDSESQYVSTAPLCPHDSNPLVPPAYLTRLLTS